MSELLRKYFDSLADGGTFTSSQLFIALSSALLCGFVIAETYRRTHRGVSTYRPFLQVILVVVLVVAFVTLVVGDDLARAFTLVGALSVIRFRTAVKEARDLGFIFWAVAVGIGAGSLHVSATILFSIALAVLFLVLGNLRYGVKEPDVKILRVRVDSSASYDTMFEDCFDRYLASRERLSVSLVRQGLLYELVFLVRLAAGAREQEFLAALRELSGDHPVTLSTRDQETEF